MHFVFDNIFHITDDQVNTSASDTFVRTRKSTRIMSRLLQSVYSLFKIENAE